MSNIADMLKERDDKVLSILTTLTAFTQNTTVFWEPEYNANEEISSLQVAWEKGRCCLDIDDQTVTTVRLMTSDIVYILPLGEAQHFTQGKKLLDVVECLFDTVLSQLRQLVQLQTATSDLYELQQTLYAKAQSADTRVIPYEISVQDLSHEKTDDNLIAEDENISAESPVNTGSEESIPFGTNMAEVFSKAHKDDMTFPV